MELKEFGFDGKTGGIGAAATWNPNEAEQRAAWRLLLQLGTRTSIAPLPDDEGLIGASLESLHNFFGITREVLEEAGPSAATGRKDGDPSLAVLAAWILNEHIRPVLTKWHPRLENHMSLRPPDIGVRDWEGQWTDAAAARAALVELREILRRYLRLLGKAAGTTAFAEILTPDDGT